MIAIIDYGLGNLRSISRKIERLGYPVIVTRNINKLRAADKLILPGVGHFKTGMQNLKKYRLIPVLNELVLVQKKPILGICLGLQLFCQHSQEGDVDGLGWLKAEVKSFKNDPRFPDLPIPHMGWNKIDVVKDNKLLNGINKNQRFYFVHSYFVDCDDKIDVIAQTKYGVTLVSAMKKHNIYGTQFHPEKSHIAGLNVIENYIKNA